MGKILHYINPNNKGPNIKTTFHILVYFLITFIVIRLFIYSMVYGLIPEFYLYIKGVHVHHLNLGILILAFAGYFALVNDKESLHSKIAKLYGIGLAFTFDEFGLWLFLRDDYWVRQSYDAIVVIAVIFLSIIYFNKVWLKIFYESSIFWQKVSKSIEEEMHE